MSVRIIIERKFKNTPDQKYLSLIDEIRTLALRQRGYVGGETYVNLDDEREVIVFSAWSELDDWKNWLNNQERAKLEDQLTHLLQEPASIRTLIPRADFAKKAFAKYRQSSG
jgi:heme-degrading monooxygenase HmoA